MLFAPGASRPCGRARRVCRSTKPVNFMVGIKGKSFSVGELAAAGVRRISLATSLYRVAMTALVDAARGVKERGEFDFSIARPRQRNSSALMQI